MSSNNKQNQKSIQQNSRKKSYTGSGYNRPLQIQITYNTPEKNTPLSSDDKQLQTKSETSTVKESLTISNTDPTKQTAKPQKTKRQPDSAKQSSASTSQPQQPSNNVAPKSTKPRAQKPVQMTLAEEIARTTDPIDRAELIRQLELSQIERRFSSLGWSFISTNSTQVTANVISVFDIFEFSLPITDPDFPFDIVDNLLRLRLSVPKLYPTSKQTTISVLNSEIPADLRVRVERGWIKKANIGGLSLLQMCNWLDRELEQLLIRPPESSSKIVFVSNLKTNANAEHAVDPSVPELIKHNGTSESPEKIPVVPAEDSSSDETDTDYTNTDEESDEESAPTESGPTMDQVHRGIQIRLPNINIIAIALMKCTSLNLLIRCTRCKNTVEVPNLTPATEANPQPLRIPCPTCSTILSIRYRSDLVHKNNTSIGYLDVDLCVPYDLLPSTYTMTCAYCNADSTQVKKMPRGLVTNTNCGQCHHKMSVMVDEVKFVGLAPSDLVKANQSEIMGLKKKRKKKELMLVVGESLPHKGTCKHYKKSYRWLRFPCCGKLYPCDKCHDEKSEDSHEMVFANRMVCGYCSKEQQYSPEKPCNHCGKALTASAASSGNPFWEGGKGVRDKVKLSSRDKRKFAGLGKTVSRKAMEKK
ncbi:hypothetical protein HK098_005140 [Nowakowskiella sp. JEL0407]|nr:hypothetical protein HK098_005140 [Nowakowskiella sp. JEL0407]